MARSSAGTSRSRPRVDLIRRPQSISMLAHRRPAGHNDRGSCKRLKDILDQIVADLGGADMISKGQRRLCRRATTLSIQAEAMECDAFENSLSISNFAASFATASAVTPAIRAQARGKGYPELATIPRHARQAARREMSTCSAIARASSTSMLRYLTVPSIIVWPSRSCTACRDKRSSID
jgi:hypothetical protein